jgi:hypothetical protein
LKAQTIKAIVAKPSMRIRNDSIVNMNFILFCLLRKNNPVGLVLCMALDCFGLRPRNDDYVLASEAKQSRKKRMHKTMPRKV